jgi:hypothetical protein
MKDDPISSCPECSGAVKRLLYPVGIVFKGSGWYVNDSRKPEKNESGDAKPSDAKKDDSKTDSATPSESKTEAKSEPAAAAPSSDKS